MRNSPRKSDFALRAQMTDEEWGMYQLGRQSFVSPLASGEFWPDDWLRSKKRRISSVQNALTHFGKRSSEYIRAVKFANDFDQSARRFHAEECIPLREKYDAAHALFIQYKRAQSRRPDVFVLSSSEVAQKAWLLEIHQIYGARDRIAMQDQFNSGAREAEAAVTREIDGNKRLGIKPDRYPSHWIKRCVSRPHQSDDDESEHDAHLMNAAMYDADDDRASESDDGDLTDYSRATSIELLDHSSVDEDRANEDADSISGGATLFSIRTMFDALPYRRGLTEAGKSERAASGDDDHKLTKEALRSPASVPMTTASKRQHERLKQAWNEFKDAYTKQRELDRTDRNIELKSAPETWGPTNWVPSAPSIRAPHPSAVGHAFRGFSLPDGFGGQEHGYAAPTLPTGASLFYWPKLQEERVIVEEPVFGPARMFMNTSHLRWREAGLLPGRFGVIEHKHDAKLPPTNAEPDRKWHTREERRSLIEFSGLDDYLANLYANTNKHDTHRLSKIRTTADELKEYPGAEQFDKYIARVKKETAQLRNDRAHRPRGFQSPYVGEGIIYVPVMLPSGRVGRRKEFEEWRVDPMPRQTSPNRFRPAKDTTPLYPLDDILGFIRFVDSVPQLWNMVSDTLPPVNISDPRPQSSWEHYVDLSRRLREAENVSANGCLKGVLAISPMRGGKLQPNATDWLTEAMGALISFLKREELPS